MYQYAEYEYEFAEFRDAKKNKRILSLARRNKFYLKQLEHVIKPTGWCMFPKSYKIVLATKKVRKDYKIVGFVVYSMSSCWGQYGTRFSTCLDYWLVDKNFRGQGIGRELYDWVVKKSQYFGNENICVMFKKNDEGLKTLYTKLGFNPIAKYDGKEQREEQGEHLLWWKIVIERKVYQRGTTDEVVWELV
jgi:ribosomal protein S18 acetylase RimI-like enzyme